MCGLMSLLDMVSTFLQPSGSIGSGLGMCLGSGCRLRLAFVEKITSAQLKYVELEVWKDEPSSSHKSTKLKYVERTKVGLRMRRHTLVSLPLWLST